MISFVCSCGRKLRVSDDHAGKRGKCPNCQAVLTIPQPQDQSDDLYGLAEDSPPPRPRQAAGASFPEVAASLPIASAPAAASVATAATHERREPSADDSPCPSCNVPLPAKAKICVRCGIYVPSGRPVLLARGIDDDMLEIRGSVILKIISWIIPWGVYPVYSEAGGRHRPYATWAIALLTIVVSGWFWCYEWTDSTEMQSKKNLMLWPRHARFDAEHADLAFNFTSYGDRKAYEQKLEQYRSDKSSDEEVIQRAYNDLTPEQRSLGEFRWYQVFTHQFLHADIWHLAGNLLFLLILGSRVNAVIGQGPTLVLYPLLGVAASWDALFTANAAPVASIGASGAIMGLAGMYLILYPLHRMHMASWWRWGLMRGFKLSYKFFAVRSFWVLLSYILLDVVMLILGRRDGVAHWAHVGGFVGGMTVAVILLGGRLVYSGGDLLSLALGRHAWWLVGTPHRHWTKRQAEASAQTDQEAAA